ncbi:hypothetical protein [Brasilonema sp. UFV-L1]|uniref:hypothetical protein n=1 Tax=Brasilonema sp. UFV-L1 TaxID=2234130 RepID=UPI00145CBCA5|nr:hypothetical protein [Brasilonema sp. UFV-L1]NMG06776.1 hypothetical protein [Brasilonema sp. UFV-L1]
MYNQMLRAFTKTSLMLIGSQRAKLAVLSKDVTPKTKVIVLNTTENKNTQSTKVFISHLNTSGVLLPPTV